MLQTFRNVRTAATADFFASRLTHRQLCARLTPALCYQINPPLCSSRLTPSFSAPRDRLSVFRFHVDLGLFFSRLTSGSFLFRFNPGFLVPGWPALWLQVVDTRLSGSRWTSCCSLASGWPQVVWLQVDLLLFGLDWPQAVWLRMDLLLFSSGWPRLFGSVWTCCSLASGWPQVVWLQVDLLVFGLGWPQAVWLRMDLLLFGFRLTPSCLAPGGPPLLGFRLTPGSLAPGGPHARLTPGCLAPCRPPALWLLIDPNFRSRLTTGSFSLVPG